MFQTLSRFGLFQLSNRGWQTGGEYHHTGKHSKVQNELRAAGLSVHNQQNKCGQCTFLQNTDMLQLYISFRSVFSFLLCQCRSRGLLGEHHVLVSLEQRKQQHFTEDHNRDR